MKCVTVAMVLCSMFALVSIAVADDRKDKSDELQGSWAGVSRVRDGEKQSVEKWVITLEGEKFQTTADGKVIESGTIKLDTTKSPKTYTAEITGDFPNKGEKYNGIYKVDGDTLTLCVNVKAGKEAPSEFVSKPDTGHQLIVWSRVKK